MSKKVDIKKILRNCKKLTKSINDCKADKKADFKEMKGQEKFFHYCTKFDQLIRENKFETLEVNDEMKLELLKLWDACNEHLKKSSTDAITFQLFDLIYTLMNIPQYQPFNLADFPAPDEVSPNVRLILISFYKNICKTAIFIIVSLDMCKEVMKFQETERVKRAATLEKQLRKSQVYQMACPPKPLEIEFFR